ncbi:Fanconi anemia group A protein isoform X2 [Gouania willdenowi]|uniref:Fanconi anemia group A protein isoform X2 n=1 Tax=Gouania willdenowi TaxID=441366 RepID=UPI0010544474|nr:Fanconi anemia group A protein isoform X2 [Gouania willdenowi]
MSLNPTFDSVSQKRSLSSLLAGRVVKRPKAEDGEQLHDAAIQLLGRQPNLCSLLREAGENQKEEQSQTVMIADLPVITGKVLANELRREAARLDVSAAALSVKTVLERMSEIIKDEKRREMLTPAQRVQLCVLLESCRELLCQGVLCPKLLWQEFRREQRLPKLELVYHLHSYNIISMKLIMESDEDFREWSVSQLKSLCGWTPPQEEEEEETKHTQHRVLSTVVGVLVGAAFDTEDFDLMTSLPCCSVLDNMLYWLLDQMEDDLTSHYTEAQAKRWIQMYDASLCGASVSPEALQHFFTHCLTQTLTYKPRLTVSDAVSLQSKWTFCNSSHLLTALYRKLAVSFSVEQLLCHMHKVLETHEVNWKHVLCFCSTLLVYYHSAQSSLRELLSRLLNAAFAGYDLENMITAFLLARQGGLEGPAIFPSYSDWFKMTFGGSSGCHTSTKKSLVFLLKFLSDLVPFEPPQYLKVHILHPPYVSIKHRALLMEYVSLAKTRLSDLKESVEDMGLYEDVSAVGTSVQPQCQAAQDVEKAVSLFKSTGRLSATVMEASIFRRPYFLTRFLTALLKPRMLPLKADARMSFIEALKKADKIPAAQYSSYVESCQKQRQQTWTTVCSDPSDDPLEVLQVQLQEFTQLVLDGHSEEMSAQLSRISHTIGVSFPNNPREQAGQTVIRLQVDSPLSTQLHVKVSNLILRHFCQCILDTSQVNSPNRQSLWASSLVSTLLSNTQLLSSILHRLWDLFHNQTSLLSPSHVLGLAALMVHLQASMPHRPLIQLVPPIHPEPVTVVEAVSSALVCRTRCEMMFCLKLCSAAVCYGICRGDSVPEHQQQDYIPCSLYKKRLLPEARTTTADPSFSDHQVEPWSHLWSSITSTDSTWRRMALMLWTHTSFQKLKGRPQCQLLFTEWLDNELRVQRSEDALSDFERQEYQQWACTELYLTRPEEQGGCGGDLRNLCSHLLNAIMDHHLSEHSVETRGQTEGGMCQPDVLSRLQEAVYEMEVCGLSADLCDFLFEMISQRCSSTAASSIGSELSLQHILHTWNSVMLSLPAVVLFKVKTEIEKMTLDCDKMIQHVNQHQRMACHPVGLLSCHMTTHLLKGFLYAAARCDHPAEEVNKAWTCISVSCPLLLVSTAHWWQYASPVLSSMWCRLRAGESLPEQLQLIADCQRWACSLEEGHQLQTPPAGAAALLLAACLRGVWRSRTEQSFSRTLKSLQPERDAKHKEMLVFLLFLCVNDYLSSLLYPQVTSQEKVMHLCTELLKALLDSADWLHIFNSDVCGVYKPVSMVTPDQFTRLMPWAFCSLLSEQCVQLQQQRALRCAGFLHTAVSCYIDALQLFLDGQTPLTSARSEKQVNMLCIGREFLSVADETLNHTQKLCHQTEPSHMLGRTKEFILRVISQSSSTALSSSQFRQLESRCTDVDLEVAAALSVHFDPPSLSPEMDFL